MKIIGQRKIMEELREVLPRLKKEKKVFPHTILYGDRGLGKSRIANYIAKKLKKKFFHINGGSLKNINIENMMFELRENKGGVIFIDEIHSMKNSVAEELYAPMQDQFYIWTPFKGETLEIDIPPFTVVGATTEAGDITKPLFDRFVYHYILQPYSEGELQKILLLNNEKKITEEIAYRIAKLSQGNPRVALNNLRKIENLTDKEITHKVIDKFKYHASLTEEGFTALQIKYIAFLANIGEKVGRNALSSYLQIPKTYIEHNIEPPLLQRGFILRSPGGRKITDKGHNFYIHIIEDKNEN